MKTFKGHASIDFKIVVPQQFTDAFRAAAKAEDASEFHKLMQERHPENDEAFTEAIIANALRRVIRNCLCDELASVGLGATVSPVKMSLIGTVPDHDAEAVPQVLHITQRPDGCVDVHSSDDPGGALAYIASNHSPVNPALSHGGID